MMPLWFFWTIAVTGLLVAAALLYWGLWADRSKGKLRCPGCWYDMSGSFEAGRLACPECGLNARHEKRLRKNHRRWWAIVVMVLLISPHAYGTYVWSLWYSEQDSIDALGDFGASCHTDEIGPNWLVEIIPRSLRNYGRVRWVDLRDARATDAALVHLRDLPQMRSLQLSGIQITDKGLVDLNKAYRLSPVAECNLYFSHGAA